MKILLFSILFLFSCHQEKPKPKVRNIPFTKEEIKNLANDKFPSDDQINIYLISNAKDKINSVVEKVSSKMKKDISFRSDRVIHLSHEKISYENFDEILRLFELPQKSYIYFFLNFDNHEKQIKAFERLQKLGHRPFLIPLKDRSELELIDYVITTHHTNRNRPFPSRK